MPPFNNTSGTQRKEIKRYYPAYYGGGKRAVNPYKYRAIIGFYDDAGLLGAAYFYVNNSEMPNQDFLYANGQIHIAYPAEEYAHILDLLRNESPCYIRYVPGWEMASINTSLEPVGEGET